MLIRSRWAKQLEALVTSTLFPFPFPLGGESLETLVSGRCGSIFEAAGRESFPWWLCAFAFGADVEFIHTSWTLFAYVKVAWLLGPFCPPVHIE